MNRKVYRQLLTDSTTQTIAQRLRDESQFPMCCVPLHLHHCRRPQLQQHPRHRRGRQLRPISMIRFSNLRNQGLDLKRIINPLFPYAMCFKISARGSGFENLEILKIFLDCFNPKVNNQLKCFPIISMLKLSG